MQTTKKTFKCPTFTVPSKGKDTSNDHKGEKKPASEESCNKSKETKAPEDSVDHIGKERDIKDTCGGNSESGQDDLGATEVTPAGDVGQQECEKKVVKKKPAFQVKQKDGESKESTVKIEKPKVTKKKKSENNSTSDKKQECDEAKKQKKEKAIKLPKEPKEKKQKEPRIPKEPKEKKTKLAGEPKAQKETKPKPPALPVRSLTDEEYESIFLAAIESAMAINIEEWEPKVSSPVVVKKKKYSITVGKKSDLQSAKVSGSQKSDHDGGNAITAENQDNTVEEAVCDCALEGRTETATEGNGRLDNDDDDDDIHDDDEHYGNEVDENNNDIAHDGEQHEDQDNESVDLVQHENERTPEGSEVNYETTPAPVPAPACASPPAKKKKISSDRKKQKLEPKSLSFEHREDHNELGKKEPDAKVETAKEKKSEKSSTHKEKKTDNLSSSKEKPKDTSVKEKIKRLKQMRREHEKPRKNRKVDENTKERKDKQENVEEQSKLAKSGKKLNKKAMMMKRIVANEGTWVQCCNSCCFKWRYLPDISDPSKVPERWVCSMNTREQYNSCDKAEEKYDESEHIYTKFTEGSVVWAKMTGYPWWPAMVEIDPDAETYFDAKEADSMIPTHYHVVFFDEKVSRTWVKADNCRLFTGSEEADDIKIPQIIKKGPSYVKEINIAKKNALKALQYSSLQERIELYGFAARFHGKWGSILEENSPDDLNKSTKAEKKKKVTCREDKKRKHQTELLDDEEIESVINNTESFLDNVEEVLDSLDSDLDDSDEDSDFNPDEILPKKKRKFEDTEIEVAIKSKSLPMYNDSESEAEVTTEEKENQNNNDHEDDVHDTEMNESLTEKTASQEKISSGEHNEILPAPEAELKSEEDNAKPIHKIKFDPEIYTMEIDDNHVNKTDVKKLNNVAGSSSLKPGNSKKKSKEKKKKFKAPAAGEIEKTENIAAENDKQTEITSKSHDQKAVSMHICESKDKTKVKGESKKSKLKISTDNKTIEMNSLEINDCFSKLDKEELKLGDQNQKDLNVSKTEKDNSTKEENKQTDSDEELDLAPEVPDINSLEKPDKKEQGHINVDEDSDDDFDLIEKSMYDNDPVLEKVHEMEVVNVTVLHSPESDSDPFDMMEE